MSGWRDHPAIPVAREWARRSGRAAREWATRCSRAARWLGLWSWRGTEATWRTVRTPLAARSSRRALLAIASVSLLLPISRLATVTAFVPPTKKLIAFSFDDAPRGPGAFFTTNERGRRLIAALRAARVGQAAFYVNPARVNYGDGDAARIAAYVAAGHVIADHTWSHPHLAKESADAYLADIDKAEGWLKPRPGYRPWFRYPFLDEGGTDKAKRDAVRAGLAARGMRDAYVTIDGSDWNMEAQAIAAKRRGDRMDLAALRDLYVETHLQSAEFSDALMVRELGRSPAHVMLLHETDLAALFLGDLVKALKADGWAVVTADQAYADPVYRTLPDSPYANGTLAEMIAWEQHLPEPRWYERNDIKVADQLFRERVLHER